MAKRRGNGEGSIYERPDGRWCGQVSIPAALGGKARRVTVYGATRAEVVDKLDEERRKIREGEAELTDMRLSVLLDFWLAGVKTGRQESTLMLYERDVAFLQEYLPQLLVSQLRAIHVTRMYQQMEADGLSADTRHKAGVRLRQVLDQAVRLDLARTNVAKKVALPRVVRDEVHPLSPERVREFLAALRGDRLYALYVTALDTGARQGELWALRWEDWNPARRELRIDKALKVCKGGVKVGPPKTKASRRTLLVTEGTAAVLEAHRVRMAAEGHLAGPMFCNAQGGFIKRSTFSLEWRRVRMRVGLPREFTFHDLRHTCATLLLMGGVDVRTVAAHLGHANPTMVLITYGHVLPAMRQRAAGVMEVMLAGGGEGSREIAVETAVQPTSATGSGCRSPSAECDSCDSAWVSVPLRADGMNKSSSRVRRVPENRRAGSGAGRKEGLRLPISLAYASHADL
jgi:integrase